MLPTFSPDVSTSYYTVDQFLSECDDDFKSDLYEALRRFYGDV